MNRDAIVAVVFLVPAVLVAAGVLIMMLFWGPAPSAACSVLFLAGPPDGHETPREQLRALVFIAAVVLIAALALAALALLLAS